MSAYTVDPTNPLEPVEGRDLEAAAAETRAMKAYIRDTLLAQFTEQAEQMDTLGMQVTLALLRDGSRSMLADLQMAGNKIGGAQRVTTNELMLGSVLLTPADFNAESAAALRGELATAGLTTGASQVAAQDAAAGARFTSVQGAINDLLYGSAGNSILITNFPWLAKCDGVTDDTASVNAASLYAAGLGSGTITWPTGKLCKIAGKLWVGSNLRYNLNGSTIVGTGPAGNTLFETGYVNAGAFVTNIGTPYQEHLVKNAKIYGGNVINVGKMCNFQNFNMGCKISDIELYNARQFGDFDACFYTHIDTVMHSGGTVDTLPSFHFKSANNSILLTKVTTTCAWDYHFAGGGTAITMIGCTQEGGVKGIKVSGDLLGLTIIGNYAEALPGTWLDLSTAGNMTYDISTSYFNYVDIVIDDDTDNYVRLGRWAESNQIVNIGGVVEGFTYRGRMQLRNRLNLVEFELNNVLSGILDVPAHWITGPNTSVNFTSTLQLSSVTDFRKKALVSGDLIPLRFSGDTGAELTGYVPFCTITLGATTHIDTKMKWRPRSLFVKFNFVANDGAGLHDVYGDIYCPHIKRHDASAMAMTISDNGGFLRISLTQTAPPFANVTGAVQLSQ